MEIVAKVGGVLQPLFGEIAQSVADRCGAIQRKRKFTSVSLAQTFVLGFMLNLKARDEDLAQMAAQCGVDVTPQAIEQRHMWRMVKFSIGAFAEMVAEGGVFSLAVAVWHADPGGKWGKGGPAPLAGRSRGTFCE